MTDAIRASNGSYLPEDSGLTCHDPPEEELLCPTDLAAAETVQSTALANVKKLPSDRVEVIFWEPTGEFASSLGHVSVQIGDQSYSFAPDGMDKRSAQAYLEKNTEFRSGHGIVLALTPEQARKLERYLQEYASTHAEYQKLTNNCTDPIEGGLRMLGLRSEEMDSAFPSGLAWSLKPLTKETVEHPRRVPNSETSGPNSETVIRPPWSNGVLESLRALFRG